MSREIDLRTGGMSVDDFIRCELASADVQVGDGFDGGKVSLHPFAKVGRRAFARKTVFSQPFNERLRIGRVLQLNDQADLQHVLQNLNTGRQCPKHRQFVVFHIVSLVARDRDRKASLCFSKASS